MELVKVVVDGIAGRLCEFQVGPRARLRGVRYHIHKEIQWQPCEQRLLLDKAVLYDDDAMVGDLIEHPSGHTGSPTLQLSMIRRDWEEAEFLTELCLTAVPRLRLLTASTELRGRKDVAMMAVEIDGCLLPDLGDDIQRDRDVVIAAVRQNGRVLQYVGETFRDDTTLVLEAIQQFYGAMEYASARLKHDTLFVRSAVACAGCCVEHVAPHLRRDKYIEITAIESQSEAYFKVDPALRGDKGFVIAAIAKAGHDPDMASAMLMEASAGLRDDQDVVFEALKSSPDALEFASERLRADREVVKAALADRDEGEAEVFTRPDTASGPYTARFDQIRSLERGGCACLQFVASELRNDPEIMLMAADVDPKRALEFASPSLLEDKDFMTEAIVKGCPFTQLAENLRDDEDVVLEALYQWHTPSHTMHNWVSERLRSSKEFIREAVVIAPELFRIASEELRGDWSVAIDALRFAMPDLMLHVAEQLLENREFAFRAIDTKAECFQYFPEKIRSDREIVLAAVKNFGSNLQYASTQLRDDIEVVATAVANCSDSLVYASTRIQLKLAPNDAGVGVQGTSGAKRRRLSEYGCGRYACRLSGQGCDKPEELNHKSRSEN